VSISAHNYYKFKNRKKENGEPKHTAADIGIV
jgi:hypothetical protein